MKLLSKIIKFRICRNTILALFFSGSGLLFNFASAQNMVEKLNDAEIGTVMPILKAEIAGYKKLMKGMETERDIKYQLFLDIQSGRTDPLDWLKQHAKHIIVPPGAIYRPACSREVSVMTGKLILQEPESDFKPSAVPTAIFTFGRDFPAINKHLLGDNMTHESYDNFTMNPINVNDPSFEKMKSIIKEADSFYIKNGFHTDYGLSYGNVLSFSHPEDEGNISGDVNIFLPALLDPTYPDVVKQCRSYVMGPVIEIVVTYTSLDKIFGSPDISKSIDENTRNSLKNAGITEDRYALVKASLINARRDSEYPEGIEIPSLDFTPTTEEEKEIARTVAIMREDALARKNNITIYNKFKAELDPILDGLEQQMY